MAFFVFFKGILYLMFKTKREKALGVNERPWRGYPIQQNSAACGPLVRARVCAMAFGGFDLTTQIKHIPDFI